MMKEKRTVIGDLFVLFHREWRGKKKRRSPPVHCVNTSYSPVVLILVPKDHRPRRGRKKTHKTYTPDLDILGLIRVSVYPTVVLY